MEEMVQLLQDFGPAAGLLLFFVWRDWKRDDVQARRIQELERETSELNKQHVDTATGLANRCQASITACNVVLTRVEQYLERAINRGPS